jgi:hypothetical protein
MVGLALREFNGNESMHLVPIRIVFEDLSALLAELRHSRTTGSDPLRFPLCGADRVAIACGFA